MCRVKRAALFIIFICFSSISLANSPQENTNQVEPTINADYWLTRMKQALVASQFEAGIVRLTGKKTESFQWLDGVI